jgi:hypothetical protein
MLRIKEIPLIRKRQKAKRQAVAVIRVHVLQIAPGKMPVNSEKA